MKWRKINRIKKVIHTLLCANPKKKLILANKDISDYPTITSKYKIKYNKYNWLL